MMLHFKFSGLNKAIFVIAAAICFEYCNGASKNLAQAVEDELAAHVRQLQLRAAEMEENHWRNIHKVKEDHARLRTRRSHSYELNDIRHGFVPGTGVGNRESLVISKVEFLVEGVTFADIKQWRDFSIGRRLYLVGAQIEPPTVFVYDFNSSIRVESENILASAMTTFTQKFYTGNVKSEETKIVIASDEGTVILVVNEDPDSPYERQNLTVNPSSVTDVAFFSIGLDSYLVFSSDAGDLPGGGERSTIYLWSATNQIFDIRQTLKTHGAVQVQAFEISGKNYILTVEKGNSSTIWQYNTRQSQFRVYQRIVPSGAKQAMYFTHSYDSFIIFITLDKNISCLYHWDGFYFHKVQKLNTPLAESWSIVRDPATCQDAPLLALSSNLPLPGGLQFFNITGSLLSVGSLPPSPRWPKLWTEGVKHFHQFSDRGDRMYGLVTFNSNSSMDTEYQSVLLTFDIYILPVPSPYSTMVQTVLQQAFTVVQRYLDEYDKKVVDVGEELEDAVKLENGELVIGGNITFNGTIIFNGTVTVGEVDAEEKVVDNSVDGVDLGAVLDELEAQQQRNTAAIAALRAQYDDRVTIDSDQTITGQKIIPGLTIEGRLEATTLETGAISGVDIETLEAIMVRNNVPDQTVGGLVTIPNGASVTGDVVLISPDTTLINGFDIRDAVTETGEQTITGTKTFSNDVTINADAAVVTAITIDSVDVSEEVVTLAGDHTITAAMTLTSPLVINGDITTTSTVDTVDVSEMEPEVVREAGGKTVTGPVTFSKPVTVDNNVTISGTANEIDLSDFDDRAVRHNVDTTISGAKIFEGDITIAEEMVLGSHIDGVNLFLDALLVNSTNSSIYGTPSYITGIMFPFGEDVGDLYLPREDDRASVEVDVAPSFPFFGDEYDTMFVNDNGIISFGIPVTEYTPESFPLDSDRHYVAPFWSDVDTRNGGTVFYRTLAAPSLVDRGEDIALFQEADRIICSSHRLRFHATWMAIVTWEDVAYFETESSKTNTYQAVLVTDGESSFAIFNYDTITWTTGVQSGGDPATGLGGTPALTGVNAGDGEKYFQNADSLTAAIVDMPTTTNVDTPGRWIYQINRGDISSTEFKGQIVTGAKNFTQCLRVEGAVHVTGTVDGVDLEKAVTLTGTCTIESEKKFVAGIEMRGDLHTTGTVDGVDVSDIASKVMTLTTRQEVLGDMTFINLTTMEEDVIVGGGEINGVNIVDLDADAVYADEPTAQTITAAKTFSASVNVTGGHVSFTGRVNTHDVENDFLDLSSQQTVRGPKTFLSGFTASANLSVGGPVDSVIIERLWSEAALTTRDETVAGNKVFAGDLSVNGALAVGSEVNGIDLSDDVMMTNTAQIVTGAKTFSRFACTNNMAAAAASVRDLNDQNWSQFVGERVTLSTDQECTGAAVFGEILTVNGDITAIGHQEVNGIHLPTFAESLLYNEGEQTITGAKTFTDTTSFSAAVTVDGTVDTVDIDDMTARAVYLDDGAQSFTAKKTFSDDLSIVNSLSISGTLNGVNLATLNSDLVWTNDGKQTITGTKVFEDGFHASQTIEVTNEVNGIDISEEILTLNGPQTVTGSYTFHAGVTIDQNLNVETLINDVDIEELAGDAMRKDTVQTVTSYIVFENDMTVSGDITMADLMAVDTVDISELSTVAKYVDVDFTLPNDVTFDLPLTINGDLLVTGNVHSVDFATWASNVFTKDTAQTVTGEYGVEGSMAGPVDINVPGAILTETAYGINVDDFVEDAVRLQGDRIITGLKTFTNDVTVEGNVVVGGEVDGIDISEEIVTLDGAQTISGPKTLDTCDVHTGGNIHVMDLVNGIEISEEHSDTLDFRNPQDISGPKTFTRDTTIDGDMDFNGLVDGKDIAGSFTLGTEQTSTAYYIFNQKASVTGSITVNGLVNTVDLANINTKRVTLEGHNTVSGALYFYDMAMFQENVTTAHLFDGVDLSELGALEEFRYNKYTEDVYDLACFAETQCERAEAIAGVVNNFIDAIDYIEQVEVIQQHVRHFQSFAVDDQTFLAAAIYSDAHGDVCTASIIYRWNTSTSIFDEFQQIDTNGAVGWHDFTIDNEVYIVVANSGHTVCHGTPSGNGIYKYESGGFVYFSTVGVDSDSTTDIAVFSDAEKHFLVLTTNEGFLTTVYLYNDDSDDFVVHQDIPTGVTSSVASVLVDDKIFLVFTLYLLEESAVYCYNTTSLLFEFYQAVPSDHARVVTSLRYDDKQGFALGDHISVTDVEATFQVLVRVFLWNGETERFDMAYTVSVDEPGDVDIFSEGNFLYLAVVQEHQSINFYRYEGSAGFIQFYEIPFYGVRTVEMVRLQDEEYKAADDDIDFDQLFMAVAVDPFPKHDIYSRVLKVINIGGSVQVRLWENMCESGLQEPTRINTPEPTC